MKWEGSVTTSPDCVAMSREVVAKDRGFVTYFEGWAEMHPSLPGRSLELAADRPAVDAEANEAGLPGGCDVLGGGCSRFSRIALTAMAGAS